MNPELTDKIAEVLYNQYYEVKVLSWEGYKREYPNFAQKYIDFASPLAKASYEAGEKAGRKEVVALALKSISNEPEFEDEMPDGLWALLKNNRDNMQRAMRNSVRLTKEEIIKRFLEQLKGKIYFFNLLLF